jgi:hypothetical protein
MSPKAQRYKDIFKMYSSVLINSNLVRIFKGMVYCSIDTEYCSIDTEQSDQIYNYTGGKKSCG